MNMRLLAFAPLFGLLLGSQSVPAADSPRAATLTWWTADSLQKIKPDDPKPGSSQKRAEMFAGRNEFEPFQIVLHAENGDATGIDVQSSDLRSPGGDTIPASNVTLYAEQFINVTQSSLAGGKPGRWPDALIPKVDRYANEKRNAFPLKIAQGSNQPVWVDVYVPENTRPGVYSGSIAISREGKPESSVPVQLTVWAFTLPSTSTLKTSFGLAGTSALKEHFGHYTSDDDLHSLTRLYAKAALLHRISVHGGSMETPKFQADKGQVHIDWGSYDSEVAPFLNGTVMGDGPLQGARATTIDLRVPNTFATEEDHAAYLAEWVKHFEKKGWADRLFLYLWDEPAVAVYPQLVKKGQASLAAGPGVRNLVTVPFNQTLEPVVQIWVPLINCLEKKPGSDDFCAEAPPLEAYRKQMEQGKNVWFYQSCASHGCNIPGSDYFNGWPSYMIDASGPANRVMQWVAWKYRMQGELYFSMNEAFGQKDPWTDMRLFGGNGDGTLFYPGKPARIGGHTDIPIESIRLKLIREGLEDYEYLALLAKLQGQGAADAFAARIVQKTWFWESRTDVFLNVRRELGETLNRAAAGQTTNGKH